MNSILGTFTAVVILSTAVVSTQNVQPQITQEVKNLTVAEEHVVSFVCKASGNPQPTFYWEKGGKKLNTRRNRFKVFDMPFGSVLRIETVKPNDNDFFTCVAKNGVGEPVRSTGHLKVYGIDREGNEFPQGYPNIIINPELKSVEKEKPTVMQCKANANGHKFEIEWFKNNVPVELGDNGRLTITRTGSLQIAKALESDYGRYECVASNEYGVAYSYAARLYVRVRRVPPHFTIPPKREEVDPNGSVNLTCVAIGSPMPYVLWRDGANQLGEIVIGKNVLQLKNVTESKNYTCVASSNLGNIEHVGEVIVRVPSQPRNIRQEVTGPNTINVFWEPPSQTRNPVKEYWVYYNDTYLKQENKAVVPGTQTRYQLQDLTPNTVYTIKVSALSEKGEGTATRIIQAITEDFGTSYIQIYIFRGLNAIHSLSRHHLQHDVIN